MDHLLLQFYYNDNCNVGSHKKRHDECTYVDKTAACLVLCKGLMMDLFNPKHVAKT